MFFRFIEHVRTQPKGRREQYALWLAVGLVGCISMTWLILLPNRFESSEEVVVGETERPSVTDFFQQIENDVVMPATDSASIPPLQTDALSSPQQLELSPETLAELAARSASTTATTSLEATATTTPSFGGRTVRIATSSATTTPATD